MRISTKTVALAAVAIAFACTAPAPNAQAQEQAADPTSTKLSVAVDNSKVTSISFNNRGEVLDIEIDPHGKGLGVTVWLPPKIDDAVAGKVDELRKVERTIADKVDGAIADTADQLRKAEGTVAGKVNELRKKIGFQVTRNPFSKQ